MIQLTADAVTVLTAAPAAPSIDQVQGALASTKTAIAAVETAWTNWSPIIAWLAVIAHMVPWFSQPAAGSPWSPVRKIFDLLAGNYGSAKNAPKV